MTSRRRGRSSFRGSARARTSWFNNASATVAVASGAQAIFDLTPLAGLPPNYEGGFTIRRMIGGIGVAAQAANAGFTGTFGIAVVTRDAVAAGAVPEPAADLVDWYYHTVVFRQAIAADVKGDVQRLFDIHTSRAIRGEGRTLVAVFDSASGAIQLNIFARLLLQSR